MTEDKRKATEDMHENTDDEELDKLLDKVIAIKGIAHTKRSPQCLNELLLLLGKEAYTEDVEVVKKLVDDGYEYLVYKYTA